MFLNMNNYRELLVNGNNIIIKDKKFRVNSANIITINYSLFISPNNFEFIKDHIHYKKFIIEFENNSEISDMIEKEILR
jgi:hypothetical protein